MFRLTLCSFSPCYSQIRDDLRQTHPCITGYDKLPASEKAYNQSLAHETCRYVQNQSTQ